MTKRRAPLFFGNEMDDCSPLSTPPVAQEQLQCKQAVWPTQPDSEETCHPA